MRHPESSPGVLAGGDFVAGVPFRGGRHPGLTFGGDVEHITDVPGITMASGPRGPITTYTDWEASLWSTRPERPRGAGEASAETDAGTHAGRVVGR